MRIIVIFVIVAAIATFSSCNENTPADNTLNDGKPTAKIITPVNNAEVQSVVPIQVEATDDKGIVKVEIYIDGIIMKEIIIPPYQYNWDAQLEVDSTLHLIYAKAYDADENVASSSVINVIVRNELPDINISYARHIQPMFNNRCIYCHGGATIEAGLVLTTWVGTTYDPNIVFPGEADLSRIVWAVEGRTGVSIMPPNNSIYKHLNENQISGLKTWINEGALNN
jgi:hypothetical protein